MQQTIFATLFTTTTPQKHHIYDAFFAKNPAKNASPPQTKKAARQKPNRPIFSHSITPPRG
jgi:hypothetical protein